MALFEKLSATVRRDGQVHASDGRVYPNLTVARQKMGRKLRSISHEGESTREQNSGVKSQFARFS